MIVVCDMGPLQYLVLIGRDDVGRPGPGWEYAGRVVELARIARERSHRTLGKPRRRS